MQDSLIPTRSWGQPRSWESVCSLLATWAMSNNRDIGCGRTTNSDMGPWQQPAPGCYYNPSWHHRSTRLAWPQLHHGHQTPTCPQVVVQSLGIYSTLVVTGTTDVNTDPGCSRAIDLNMSFCHSSGPYVIMVPRLQHRPQCMVLVATRYWKTSSASTVGPDYGLWPDPQWQ